MSMEHVCEPLILLCLLCQGSIPILEIEANLNSLFKCSSYLTNKSIIWVYWRKRINPIPKYDPLEVSQVVVKTTEWLVSSVFLLSLIGMMPVREAYVWIIECSRFYRCFPLPVNLHHGDLLLFTVSNGKAKNSSLFSRVYHGMLASTLEEPWRNQDGKLSWLVTWGWAKWLKQWWKVTK